jgi:DNA-binding beta-propeller fold protein YncE
VGADVALRHLGFVDLPAHAKAGGFDHAAVHEPTGRIYVAHTANDAVDVIDVDTRRHVESIPGLTAVAGALVAEPDLVFTSNRGENTIGVFRTGGPEMAPHTPQRSWRPGGAVAPLESGHVEKIPVGIRPNGLAYDSRRGRLLAAHVGDPTLPGSCSVSVVDVRARKRIADVAVAGRTRWTIYDPVADAFHVNIADPPQVVVVDAGDAVRIRRIVTVPHGGPHGLDIDVGRRRLFCACDAGVLLEIDADSGKILATEAIAGVPDVVFFNAALARLYVAIGDPGVIEVFDTTPPRRHEIVPTERGAHTLSFDAARNIVCAFLPGSHRAAVYEDSPLGSL